MPIELEWISKDGNRYTVESEEVERVAGHAVYRLLGFIPSPDDQIGMSTLLADIQKKIGEPVYNYKKFGYTVTIKLKE